jgi:DNA-binding transcriptional ArsR family regulator
MSPDEILDLLGRDPVRAVDILVEHTIDAVTEGSRESFAETSKTLIAAFRLALAAAPDETAKAVRGECDDQKINTAFLLGQISATHHIASAASLRVAGSLFPVLMRKHAAIADAIADEELNVKCIGEATGASPDEVAQALAKMRRAGISDVRSDGKGWQHFLTPAALAWLGANDLADTVPAGEKAARRRREIRAFFRDSDEVRNFQEAHCSSRAPWRVLVDREARLVVCGPDGNPTYGVVAKGTGFTVFGHHDPLILVDPDPEETGSVVAANADTVAEAFAAVLDNARLTQSPRP